MGKIIGFGHRSRVGKDTSCQIATQILQAHGVPVRQESFAALLKDVCHRLYGWTGLKPGPYYERNPAARDVKLPVVHKTPVEVWIEVGNQLRGVYADTWIAPVVASAEGFDGVTLISDVRYPNEASVLRSRGGTLVKVTRSEAPVRDSVADNALEGYDSCWHYIIENEGTERDLVDAVRLVLQGAGAIG